MSAPWPQPTQPPSPPLDSRANVDPAWADVEWDYEPLQGESSSSRRRTEGEGALRKRRPSPPSPSPTPPPTSPSSSHHLRPRQTIANQAAVNNALEQCQFFSGNNVISCFPTAGSTFAQGQWVTFVWNSRRPQLTQTNLVNVYLLRADSGEVILNFLNQGNPSDQAGFVRGMVNDTWFGKQGFDWNGKNVSFPFQWAITRNDERLDSNVSLQPIFTAVQTTVLSAVAAAQSSASVASASSASLASLSSASAASASAASASAASLSRSGLGPSATGGGGGNVQHPGSSSSFPRWAIAVIVVLGFLAIAASCILAFLILRRLRRRREAASQQGSRSSMGSASPMILHDGQPGGSGDRGGGGGQMSQRYTDETGAPLLPPPSLAGGAIGHSASHGHHSQYSGGGGNAGGVSYDGASTISDSGGPFSGADAAIMADAFRKMLRKPDFAGQIEEGESPGTDGTTPEGGAAAAAAAGGAAAGASGNRTSGDGAGAGGLAPPGGATRESSDERAAQREGVLSRELAEEGRDIRSVSSSRGVRVERMDDYERGGDDWDRERELRS